MGVLDVKATPKDEQEARILALELEVQRLQQLVEQPRDEDAATEAIRRVFTPPLQVRHSLTEERLPYAVCSYHLDQWSSGYFDSDEGADQALRLHWRLAHPDMDMDGKRTDYDMPFGHKETS